ncbi:hypothetical protein ACG2F4_06165 [Halalkalibaculum sp. DA3122]|uniref:Dph6-related ATP pyrophosphatase n=1 Tax=unclassified Halalkalibaculum TaxID=2964617 RepID=UPI003754D57B
MDILFWSGGKDSYLALKFYTREYGEKNNIQLLTTYNEKTDTVPHQQIALEKIKRQASHLDLPLITVPLPEDPSNEIYLERIKQALAGLDIPIDHLVFGDWCLEDIRQWRTEAFGKMGYRCLFPIWKKSLHELLPVLMLTPVEIKISAVKEEFQHLIRVGESYTQGFVRTLPESIDPMGENGEFHTEVIFRDLDREVI